MPATATCCGSTRRRLPEDLLQLHPTNRGVALYEDKVYLATVDAHLVALDARTGKVIWDKVVDDYKKGYYCTLAPLVTNGKVMVGTSGGELAIRGFIQAFDARSGDTLWRTYTIPEPGQPGSETWRGDDWKTGGGSVWIQGTFDPKLNLAFWGVGNAAPWAGDFHPGDNLFTTSVIAVDPNTGAIKAHHQYHWNDSWDWDEVTPPMLIDVQRDGRTIKGLVHPGRDGYLWLLERCADKISFVAAKPYVTQNAFKSIDPVTGRPEYAAEHTPRKGVLIDFCPSLWGGKDWPPAAYNPNTKLVYIPSNDNHCGSLKSKAEEPMVAGELKLGVEIPDIKMIVDPSTKTIGKLQAWDVAQGPAGLGPGLREPQLRTGADDRRQSGVPGRNERPLFPGVRCHDRQAAVAIPHQLGRDRRADVVHGRWRPVRGGTVGLGRRRRAHAGLAHRRWVQGQELRSQRAHSSGRCALGIRRRQVRRGTK